MADYDSISDSTPNKRRKLNESNGRGWDSQDDSSEEFTVDDFEPAATLPLSAPPRQLEYTKQQLHANVNRSTNAARTSSPPHTFVTQPTQTLKHVTQPTQSLPNTYTQSAPSRNAEILVGRSSPPLESSPKKAPEPLRRAPFAKSSGLLAAAMAPPGTSFRQPLGVQSKPQVVTVDSDEDDDPPIEHSSDDEPTQGRSNLKPTNFRRGGRNLDSTPDRSVIRDSPKVAASSSSIGPFSALLQEYNYGASTSASASRPVDDMASAYGSTTRRERPQLQPTSTFRLPKVNAISYKTIDDIPDYVNRRKVKEIQELLPFESVQRCFDALLKKKGNVNDAQAWLLEDEEQDAPGDDDDMDELSSTTPARPRGVAISSSSQSIRPAAKQEVKAALGSIATRYPGTQAGRKPSQAEEAEEAAHQPRRRLQQGRRKRSVTPPSSPVQKPPQPMQRLHRKQRLVPEDDDEEEVVEIRSDSGTLDSDEPSMSSHEEKLLKFFNDCSIDDLADLTAQVKDQLRAFIDRRPFADLDEVRAVTVTGTQNKNGKKSKDRNIGDAVAETCSRAWSAYDAIDELVQECQAIAKPLQAALKSWGVGTSGDGELQLMNLDEAHDSGIGTPASSCLSDDAAPSAKPKAKSQFLRQPPNMNSDATLKDYQLVGLNWLNLLWSQRTSCILADDMGLGKTCQVIAFLANLQHTDVGFCALVIVPGSTLENWLREFQYFAPSLNVRPYYGGQQERLLLQAEIEADSSVDVVVTTYDTATSTSSLTQDARWLRQNLNPEICIFDEAHQLRNPKSLRYEKLAKFQSEFRVLLTGTPLQNNLKELVAILAFIKPDMFRERQEALDYIFQHKATTKDPTENAALLSSQRIMRARSMVTPFILRRKKHQVLDLPNKLSRVEYCEMTETQAEYYADVLEDAQTFFAAKQTTSTGSSNIIMNLRKAALHPLLGRRLYNDNKIDKITDLVIKHKPIQFTRDSQVRPYIAGEGHDGIKGGDFALHRFCSDLPYLKKFALKNKPWMDSGKVVVFRKLIDEFAKNGDRVLVFSQFKIMMDVLEAVLQTLNIKFVRLDGSTNVQIRQDTIDTFTNDESITVFMLSTRAGGAGINLAVANKVIIFDSGFNPQDDVQAENRAHRVGQTRDVEVIRLVTRGTIDEQIHALGESKLALDARVAGEEADDTKAADKAGEQMVKQLFLDSLNQEDDAKGSEAKESTGQVVTTGTSDTKDDYKDALGSMGLHIVSKQAQF